MYVVKEWFWLGTLSLLLLLDYTGKHLEILAKDTNELIVRRSNGGDRGSVTGTGGISQWPNACAEISSTITYTLISGFYTIF